MKIKVLLAKAYPKVVLFLTSCHILHISGLYHKVCSA